MGFVIGKRQKTTGGVDACGSQGGQQGMLEWGGNCDSLRQMSPSCPPGGGDGGVLARTRARVRAIASGEARWRRDAGRWSRWPIRSNSWSHGDAHTRSSSPPYIPAASFNHKHVNESNDSTLLSPRRPLSAGGWELSPDDAMSHLQFGCECIGEHYLTPSRGGTVRFDVFMQCLFSVRK